MNLLIIAFGTSSLLFSGDIDAHGVTANQSILEKEKRIIQPRRYKRLNLDTGEVQILQRRSGNRVYNITTGEMYQIRR